MTVISGAKLGNFEVLNTWYLHPLLNIQKSYFDLDLQLKFIPNFRPLQHQETPGRTFIYNNGFNPFTLLNLELIIPISLRFQSLKTDLF